MYITCVYLHIYIHVHDFLSLSLTLTLSLYSDTVSLPLGRLSFSSLGAVDVSLSLTLFSSFAATTTAVRFPAHIIFRNSPRRQPTPSYIINIILCNIIYLFSTYIFLATKCSTVLYTAVFSFRKWLTNHHKQFVIINNNIYIMTAEESVYNRSYSTYVHLYRCHSHFTSSRKNHTVTSNLINCYYRYLQYFTFLKPDNFRQWLMHVVYVWGGYSYIALWKINKFQVCCRTN